MTRLQSRLLRHHLPLLLLSTIGTALLYVSRPYRDVLTRASFATAYPALTGGVYDAGTQMASFNFVEPYLRSVFGFLGVTYATFLTVGGTKVLTQGQDRAAFLAPHVQAAQAQARVEAVIA